MTTAAENTLPDTPSALIRTALKDLRAVERTPGYVVNMEIWHRGQGRKAGQYSGDDIYPNNKCVVCFAGSVMAKSLNVPKTKSADPDDYNKDTTRKLLALNLFREGWVASGLEELGIPLDKLPKEHRHIDVPDYSDNKKVFKQKMSQLADSLEAHGL